MKTSMALTTACVAVVVLALANLTESLKTVGKTSVQQPQQQQQQQELDFHQEELRSQQQFEQLRQQQEQATLQIQRDNEEAQRQVALQQQQLVQQQQQQQPPQLLVPRTHSWFTNKGHYLQQQQHQHQQLGAPLQTYSRPSGLFASGFERQYGPQPSPAYNVPPHSTIAYLVVRPPPYQQQPFGSFDELNAYRTSYSALGLTANNRPQVVVGERGPVGVGASATKGGISDAPQTTKGGGEQQTQLHEEQRPQQELISQQQQVDEAGEQRPISLLGHQDEQRPIEQHAPLVQAPQSALVVPVAKEGKLRALLEKIISKFAHAGSASYSVANEELIYQQPQQPHRPPVLESQQPLEQLPEELPAAHQQPQQQQLEQQELAQSTQDQGGFGEEQQQQQPAPLVKGQTVGAESSPKTTGQLEHVRAPTNVKGAGQQQQQHQDQDQEQVQLLQQQQSLSEQEINRQPIKGGQQQQQQQQQPLLETKSRRPVQQQEAPIRPQEGKNLNVGF